MSLSSASPPYKIPSSIIIVGSGAFGLATADALCRREEYNDTKIVVIDRMPFPSPDGASIDTSRIIRADYADPAYAALALEARQKWRGEWGAENRYQEGGLLVSASRGQDDYVVKSLENVRGLEVLEREKGLPVDNDAIEVCSSHAELVRLAGTGGAQGDTGYLNRGSGRADAESCMRWLRKRVMAYKRVGFISVGVEKVIFDHEEGKAVGVELCDGNYLSADLIILAAGAWTSTLVDLSGRLTATGQYIAYVEVTSEEAEILSKNPVQLNLTTGLFTMPPPHPSKLPQPPSQMAKGTLYMKLARHTFGYANPTTIPHPEDPSKGDITVSIPHTNTSNPKASQPIPKAAEEDLAGYLKTIIPPSSPVAAIAERPLAFTRLCHYADTPTGDYLIDYHPSYKRTLFIASGGSGHGFKMLPVIGDKIIDTFEGKCPEAFKDKWAWKEAVVDEWPLDGSRGGVPGLILKDEMAKTALKI